MTVSQREAAVTALLALVTNAYPWTTPPSRRLKLWSDVPKELRPAAYLFEGGNETHVWSNTAMPRRTIEVKIFVYTDCADPNLVGATQLNEIADILDAAINGDIATNPVSGRNTLGGAAYWCRIDGATLKVPGDMDGDGIIVIPVRITLP